MVLLFFAVDAYHDYTFLYNILLLSDICTLIWRLFVLETPPPRTFQMKWEEICTDCVQMTKGSYYYFYFAGCCLIQLVGNVAF